MTYILELAFWIQRRRRLSYFGWMFSLTIRLGQMKQKIIFPICHTRESYNPLEFLKALHERWPGRRTSRLSRLLCHPFNFPSSVSKHSIAFSAFPAYNNLDPGDSWNRSEIMRDLSVPWEIIILGILQPPQLRYQCMYYYDMYELWWQIAKAFFINPIFF